jgi:hypothetical protein
MWIATIASKSQKEDADIFKVIKSVRSHQLEKLKQEAPNGLSKVQNNCISNLLWYKSKDNQNNV